MSNAQAEIMAPCGSFAGLEAAIKAGCDSIFFGVSQLNMRARSAYNFEIEDIYKVAERCNAAGVRSYIALNTLLYQHDLALMRRIIDTAKDAGISAVIVADMAALQYARSIDMEIQASTQLSISNYESVKFFAQFADTVVLAREVDIKMMKDICDQIKKDNLCGPAGKLVKVEVFVHGALCIAQSGRCQMSLLQNNTSAQRGACLQECRKKYRVIEDETKKEMVLDGGYIMSPHDLCCISFLDKIIEAGVSILKIEGRAKSPEYVDVVVRCYKEAVEAIADGSYTTEKIDSWLDQLKSVYNRGFCEGYYLGQPLPNLRTKQSGSEATVERIYVGLVQHHFPKAGIAEIELQAYPLSVGDKISIIGNTTGVVYEEVTSLMHDEKVIQTGERKTNVTLPVKQKVRQNDKVYLLRDRN